MVAPKRKARSLRLPEVLDSALEAKADELGFSVQRLIEIAVDDWLAGQEASQTGSLYSNLGTSALDHLQTLSPAPVVMVETAPVFRERSCPHPRKSRQVFSWGSKCGECGARL